MLIGYARVSRSGRISRISRLRRTTIFPCLCIFCHVEAAICTSQYPGPLGAGLSCDIIVEWNSGGGTHRGGTTLTVVSVLLSQY